MVAIVEKVDAKERRVPCTSLQSFLGTVNTRKPIGTISCRGNSSKVRTPVVPETREATGQVTGSRAAHGALHGDDSPWHVASF